MRRIQRVFLWICRPQAFIGFVALCLCVGAAGTLGRAHNPSSTTPMFRQGPPLSVANQPNVDCALKPCIALTFDDGPNPEVTPQILDILTRQEVKATFFIVGMRVPGQESLLRREHREGHEIGNHSWSHPDLSTLSPEDAERQIQATQQVIAAAGVPAPKILRPPYGAVNEMVAAHNNLSIVRWNVDPEDWKIQDPGLIDQALLSHVHPGSIILLHDIYPTTVAAVEPAIQALKPQYQFVTVSQLLDLTPGDQGQFFARYK